MPLAAVFTNYSCEKLEQLMSRIEFCVGQLTPEQIWTRNAESQNAVGNLLLHLAGNVRQWILFGVAGEPDHRERDKEFSERGPIPAEQLLAPLRSTVQQAVSVIRSIDENALAESTSIQKYHLTKLQAIYHVVEHFSGHTGQIILLTKLCTSRDLGFYTHLGQKTAHGETTP